MRSSRIGLATSVVLAACGGAVNVGGPQDDAGSGATSSSSGAGNTGSSSGPTSSSSSSGAGGGSNATSSSGTGSGSGGTCAPGIVPGCTSTTFCDDPSGCGGWNCNPTTGQWYGNDIGISCSPGICPESPPAQGSACAAPALQCSSWKSGCGPTCTCENATMGAAAKWNCAGYSGILLPICADGGTASDASTGASDAALPDAPFNPGGPIIMCPSSYAVVPMDKQCAHAGLQCAYPAGHCSCAQTAPATATYPVWQCVTLAAGCPQSPPRVGSSCSQAGLTCNYGVCTGGSGVVCTGGSWQPWVLPCPS